MGIGFHLPFSGNVKKIVKRLQDNRANTFQIYSRGLRGVSKGGVVYPLKEIKTRALKEYQEFKYERNIRDMVLHAPFVFTVVGEENEFLKYIIEDLDYADELDIPYYVLPVGAQKDMHEYDAMESVKDNLRNVLDKSKWTGTILIKNSSGAGTEMPRNLDQWNELISFHDRVKGACDIARLYSFGMDVLSDPTQVFEDVEVEIGWDKIELLYLNDTLLGCGDRKNRFIPIGTGVIGFEGMEKFLMTSPVLCKMNWIMEYMESEEYKERDRALERLVSARWEGGRR
ncbi:hypothetical protein bcgnr5372_35400 [Bacillus luti]|nr:TIM barrel protein [Bacillus cereus]HDR8329248.1 TIM barrel protein [Bacillus cereus]HDR8333041.1 TIM barrel protein [Bacillus cereus]